MAVITMQRTKELLSRLEADYPDIKFVMGSDFKWSKDKCELTIDLSISDATSYLLHELGHALLGHETFIFDIDLLRQEREAWDYARSTLAMRYNVSLDDALIEDSLDTYREWLHLRSVCPSCGLTGLQTKTSTYRCINCGCSWRPNDARRANLRRYKLT